MFWLGVSCPDPESGRHRIVLLIRKTKHVLFIPRTPSGLDPGVSDTSGSVCLCLFLAVCLYLACPEPLIRMCDWGGRQSRKHRQDTFGANDCLGSYNSETNALCLRWGYLFIRFRIFSRCNQFCQRGRGLVPLLCHHWLWQGDLANH